MRAAGISEFGGAVGRIDLPDPRPVADDEVLIEIRAAGVGNWEEFVRTGEWEVGRAPPMALGVEAAGIITAIGDSVEDWEPGDEVLSHPLPLRDQGAWAPLLIASATVLARKPAALSWEAAAAFPVPALTATQVIDGALAVRPDDLVLVNGGSGAIGTVRDGGHLATITQDPPDEQRGIEISSVIVEPDGRGLGELAELLAAGKLEVSTAATFPLEDAAAALAAATGGSAGGAVVLRP